MAKLKYTQSQIEQVIVLAGSCDAATAIMQTMGNECALWQLEMSRQYDYARTLLKQHLPRTVIAERMTQRFGISIATAWRRISDALKKPLSNQQVT